MSKDLRPRRRWATGSTMLLAGVLVSGLVTYVALRTTSSHDLVTSKVDTDQQELRALKARLRALEQRPRLTREVIGGQATTPQADSSVNDEADEAADPGAGERWTPQAVEQRQQRWADAIVEGLRNQPVDSAWNASVQGELAQTLQEDRFQDITLEELECGGRLCRLLLTTQALEETARDDLLNELFGTETFMRNLWVHPLPDGTREVFLAQMDVKLTDFLPQ